MGAPTTLSLIGAVLLLVAVSGLVWWVRRSHPYLLSGWLIFGGMLVPVIGLVQVGGQALADRYTYLPSIGLSISVVFAGAALAAARPVLTRILVGIALGAVSALCVLTWFQVGYWKDTTTLFTHTASVTQPNSLVEVVLGNQHTQRGEHVQAIQRFRTATELNPSDSTAWMNLGLANGRVGNASASLRHLVRAVQAGPQNAKAHYNLGNQQREQGTLEEAIRSYRRAIELWPTLADAHTNLAIALLTLQRFEAAIAEFRYVVRLVPRGANGYHNLGTALLTAGHPKAAIPELEAALRLNPRHSVAKQRLQQARKAVRENEK
jgi:tetratricopeptide (TPR) repeat protein